MSNISLHPLWLIAMPVYQHVIGVATHALSALALYLMITKTPETGRPFARYLIFMQISITLVDLNFAFLFCPILLYPAPGLLCNGVLCTVLGDSGHSGMVLLSFAVLCSVASVTFAYHFKFLTLLEMAKHKTFSNFHASIFRVIIFIFYHINTLFAIGLYRNLKGGADIIRTNFPSLTYLFKDRKFRAFAYDLGLYPSFITVFGSISLFSMVITLLVHTVFGVGSFYLLYIQNVYMSEKTRRLHLRTFWLLFFQGLILFMLQFIPVAVNIFSLITQTLSPDIANVLFCVQLTHASVHSVVVLSTNSKYREQLIFWRRDRVKKMPSSFSTTTKLS